MALVTKKLNEIVNSEVNANGKIFDNQIECAKKILYAFDSDYPKSNYVVVDGETQSGKTGVLFATVNLINRLRLRETIGINRVIYLTGSNERELKNQQVNRCDELMSFNEDDVEVLFMKNSDFKKYINDKKNKSIDGTILFIDESHYGTSKEFNQLPKFLKHYGIDYLTNTNLEEHNVRIISSSATVFSEIASDLEKTKIVVRYEPGPGYIGINDFIKNNNVVELDRNIFDNAIVDKALPNFLNDAYNHLKSIEENTGNVKCAIVRVFGNRRTRNDFDNLKKYGSDKFDFYQFDTSDDSSLKYDTLWDKIDLYCVSPQRRTPGKYLMVVIKGALRMGMTVRDEGKNNFTKNHISVLYDYTKTQDNVQATIQGLLGRMCGYRADGDEEWKDLMFYLNKTHWQSIVNHRAKGIYDEDGNPRQMEIGNEKECLKEISDISGMVSEYDAKKQGLDVEQLKKDSKLYKIDVQDTHVYLEYDATDFYMSKIGTKFGGFDNFKLSDLKTHRANFTYGFIKPFLVSVDSHFGQDDYVQKGSRRCGPGVRNDDKELSFVNELKDKGRRMHVSNSAYPFKNEDLGKYAWQALLNMDEMDDPLSPKITVSVKVSQMKPFIYVNDFVKSGTVRQYETMITRSV